MAKKKAFGQYTSEEVFEFEASAYMIVAGYNVFNKDGTFFFNKKDATRYYNKILNELIKQLHMGSKKDKKEAKMALNSLRVEPLRIH